MRFFTRQSVACAATAILVAGVAAGTPDQAAAQQDARMVHVISAEGAAPDLDIRTVRQGFNLFASGDAALAGMRMTGNFGSKIDNYGDCNNVLTSCQNQRLFQARGGTGALWFLNEWLAGAPPSEWLKIRAVAPEAANATGGGFTAGFNGDLVGRPLRFGPHDGTLGTLFSGVTSTEDGSCRDNTGAANGQFFGRGISGIQILAASDCPPTWGQGVWQGAHPIDGEGWNDLFEANSMECDVLGTGVPAPGFCFDYWRVPEANQRLDKMFLGTGFHTFGETSDFMSDILASYGGAVPGGSGAPSLSGYPLGLVIRFEAFNFAVPTVASVKWVRATIINRSEDVWGAPVDYDSLYFGLSEGTLQNTQTISRYWLPHRNMSLYHNDNARGAGGPCDDSFRSPIPNYVCGNGSASASRGYGNGAAAIIVFKSPLGDMRNKLFTRTQAGLPCTVGADPFCDPSHPLRGDTITFNQGKFGEFGSADAATWGTSARAGFGYLSGTADNTLDGRAVTDLSERAQWATFRNIGFPGVRGVYNKFVPGAPGSPGSMWDYNHDGTPDTLYLDSCGPAGCVQFSSDTLPSSHVNRRGNVGGVLAAGPFPLAAGDSTSWFYAVIGDGDSTQLWSQVEAATDLYMNFFLAPEAPPRAEVVSTSLTPGTDQFGTANPLVQIFFSDAPERWVDPFLSKVADDIANAAPGTPLNDLLVANPGLDVMVAARAADNLRRIEVYRSCDGGVTFDSDGDCDADPATDVDGNAVGFGWEAFSIFDVDANDGDVPNVFQDGAVDGGREYLYVFVAQSRGATFLLNTATGPDSVTFAPSIRNVLSRSTGDANVVSVYVPASRQAGFQPASATFTSRPVGPTAPFALTFTDSVLPGSYRAVFGNEVVVDRDSSIADGDPLQSRVTVQRREMVDVAGVSVDSVIRRERFILDGGSLFPMNGTGAAAGSVTLMDTVRTTTVFSGLSFVLTGPDGNTPVFGTTQLVGAGATPTTAFAVPTFSGFTIEADNQVAGTFNGNNEVQLRGQESIDRLNLLPSDTVVPRNVVNNFMVQWREGSSTITSDAGGVYVVSWDSDPFGLPEPLTLNFANSEATEAELRAALASRPATTIGLTDQATADVMGVDVASLVPVQLPFSVENTTFGRPVDVAMVERISNRILLGNGTDTISVEVPPDQWVPGDNLVFIETITEDSTTAAGIVLNGSGAPVQRTRRAVTVSPALLGCDSPRESCNPVRQETAGATGYNPMSAGDQTRFEYFVGFDATNEFVFDVLGPVTGEAITAVTDSALSLIRVVPNPFVIFSEYQSSVADSRILFTNMPSRGTLRIYTIAGQFVQQIDWEPADLLGAGDLFYNLRTREGIDMASGLYLWVVTAPRDPSNPSSAPIQARGKFVIIRGDSR